MCRWQVYLYLDTLCPNQLNQMEFGVNTLLSCSSKTTSIFSVPTVLTRTTGNQQPDAMFNDLFYEPVSYSTRSSATAE